MTRRLPVILLVGSLLALGLSAGAGAKPAVAVPTLRPAKEPGLTLGLSGAEDDLTIGTPASEAAWAKRAHGVGAQFIRLVVDWASVAPGDPPANFDASDSDSPGYDWSLVDEQVQQLTAEGFRIMITIDDAPSWAEGADVPAGVAAGSWEPSATDLGEFGTALATRYDGDTPGLPRVSYWQPWNEPNLPQFLTPQWSSTASTATALSPGIYRNMQNTFYDAVKAVSPTNFVVAAGTGPYGDPPGGPRLTPVTFDQDLLCLTAQDRPAKHCPGPTEMDAIDDHPYVSGLCCHGPTLHAGAAGDTSVPDVYKIVDVLHAAEAAHTVGPGKPQVWATEIGWNTDPPNTNPRAASPAAVVGKWATQALYILWSQGVNTVFWYQIGDDPADSPPGTYIVTEGLYRANGVAKPAAASFTFPFLTNRTAKTRLLAWGRAPRAGVLQIQRRRGRGWVTVAKLKVSATQVFEATLDQRAPATYRAVVDHIVSPTWTQAG